MSALPPLAWLFRWLDRRIDARIVAARRALANRPTYGAADFKPFRRPVQIPAESGEAS